MYFVFSFVVWNYVGMNKKHWTFNLLYIFFLSSNSDDIGAYNSICTSFLQINEIKHISGLPCMEKLSLIGNSVTIVLDYRTKVLAMFSDRANEVTTYSFIYLFFFFFLSTWKKLNQRNSLMGFFSLLVKINITHFKKIFVAWNAILCRDSYL